MRPIDREAARVHQRAASRHEDAAARLRALGLTEGAAAAEEAARQQHDLADQLLGSRRGEPGTRASGDPAGEPVCPECGELESGEFGHHEAADGWHCNACGADLDG